jgi:hypothetical protein
MRPLPSRMTSGHGIVTRLLGPVPVQNSSPVFDPTTVTRGGQPRTGIPVTCNSSCFKPAVVTAPMLTLTPGKRAMASSLLALARLHGTRRAKENAPAARQISKPAGEINAGRLPIRAALHIKAPAIAAAPTTTPPRACTTDARALIPRAEPRASAPFELVTKTEHLPRRTTRLVGNAEGPRLSARAFVLLRGQDLNLRPLGYEPSELPNCSTPRHEDRA